MQSVERRSYAAQFWRAWPGLTTLRKVARALFEHGVLGQEWPGVRQFADQAGVSHTSVTKYRQRALAVGLPLVPELDDDFPFDWMPVRRECAWTMLRAGRFTEWVTLIERVDALCAEIEDSDECDRVAYVGQAIVSLRLRGMAESRPSVRDELKAEGVELKFRNEELGKLIASVRKALEAK